MFDDIQMKREYDTSLGNSVLSVFKKDMLRPSFENMLLVGKMRDCILVFLCTERCVEEVALLYQMIIEK